MKRLIVLIAIAISGCASVPSEYWERTWEGALTTTVHVVGASPWGPEVKGWTVCDKVKRHCDILIVQGAADRDCVEAHERRHAAGFDHPKYPRAFIC
jgi:hypothetical protein